MYEHTRHPSLLCHRKSQTDLPRRDRLYPQLKLGTFQRHIPRETLLDIARFCVPCFEKVLKPLNVPTETTSSFVAKRVDHKIAQLLKRKTTWKGFLALSENGFHPDESIEFHESF